MLKKPIIDVPINSKERELEFRNVEFSYPNRDIVFNLINFTIPLNKKTIIIGPSGAGKSTLAELLMRFWVPQNGSIFFNGVDIQNFDLQKWREKIGYLGQECFIMDGTLKENVLMGKHNATNTEINWAIKMANLESFVAELPQGLDAVLQERGANLSGGQRQRLALARAIVGKPEILIFDEATSALDSESEAYITKSIKELSQTLTVIVITHKLNIIDPSDTILKIENGIAEKINFKDLHGFYSKHDKIVEKQIGS